MALVVALMLNACGNGDSDPGPEPPPNPLYVRASVGDDTNSGADPDNALRTISRAAQIALSDYTIYVGSGVYPESVNAARTGPAPQGLMFVADVQGEFTGDRGPVTINATGTSGASGFNLSSVRKGRIDGFTITGGNDAGIVIKSGSDEFTIQNCIVANNGGDGIRIQDSSQVLIFNNLVYRNGRSGVAITGPLRGSPDARVYSNTIYGNATRQGSADRGLTVGNTSVASPRADVRSNIIQNNAGDASIKVFENPRSDLGYRGDYNLVLPATYLPAFIRGANDLGVDARFVNPATNNFHLMLNSPAIDRGVLPEDFQQGIQMLRQRTTTGVSLDSEPLDMGFHFLP
jgi:parallel beta-helix repeat protein